MYVLPVLDLLHGVVVRGVAGRRDSYRPVHSRVCRSADPLQVAQAFRDHFDLNQLYVADLDAILHQRPNFDTYRQLSQAGFDVLVDAGIRTLAAGSSVLDAGAGSIIAGLESIPNLDLLAELVAAFGHRRVVFSLDLKEGQPLTNGAASSAGLPLRIGEIAIQHGIQRLIVLDLAQVGIGEGISTLDLCRDIRTLAPQLEIITGGGVRNLRDLELLANSQIDGVLIASALHNGSICKGDLERVVRTTCTVPTNPQD